MTSQHEPFESPGMNNMNNRETWWPCSQADLTWNYVQDMAQIDNNENNVLEQGDVKIRDEYNQYLILLHPCFGGSVINSCFGACH